MGPFLKGKEDCRKKKIVWPEHDYSSREEGKKELREKEISLYGKAKSSRLIKCPKRTNGMD